MILYIICNLRFFTIVIYSFKLYITMSSSDNSPVFYYTINDIFSNFSEKDFSRGELYAAQGRVKRIIFNNEKHLIASVQGTRSNPYKVDIQIKEVGSKKTFHGSCSCPLGRGCKHIVATLLEGLNTSPTDNQPLLSPDKIYGKIKDVTPILESRATNNQGSITKKPQTLDSSLTSWLKNLNESINPTSSTTPQDSNKSGEKVLIYIIDPPKLSEAFIVSPVITSILKSGSYSSARKSCKLENVEYYRGQYVKDSDVVILRLISAFTPYSDRYDSSFKIPTGEESLLLLKLLLETGRCYLANDTIPQNNLKLAEQQNGSVGWKIDKNGIQTITVNIDNISSPLLLKLRPLHYICPATKKVGGLDIGMDYKQAIALLAAPSIKPEHSVTFNQKLSNILGIRESALLPLALQSRNLTIKPVPSLKLTTTNIQEKKTKGWRTILGESVSIAVVNLSFEYEKQSVFYDNTKNELTLFKEGEVFITPRDWLQETNNIKQLQHLGLTVTLKNLNDYYQIPSEFNSYLTIGGQKEHFHKNKKLGVLWTNFIQNDLSHLKEQGWKIQIDPSFPYNIVYTDDDWYAEINDSSGIDWFSVELGVSVEGKRVNLVPILLDLLKKDKDIFKIIHNLPAKAPLFIFMEDGRKLALPSERAKILLNTVQHLFSIHGSLDEAGRLKIQMLEAALLAEVEASSAALNMRWYGGEKIRILGKKLKDFKTIRKTSIPASFNGQLRGYQQEGLNWLQFLREYDLAGILADDMGLGKTVQMLAHIATEKAAKRLNQPVLVIANTSLMVNWKMEAAKFTPNLKVLVLHGVKRKEHFHEIPESDLVLTTYPLLLRDKDELLTTEYNTIILDEAQNIKNSNAKITQIANQLKAKHRICMTGTPLENHLGELWSLFNFILPGYLGNKKQFGNLFRIPIEKNADKNRSDILMKRIKPFILRRTKQEVVTELPSKTEIIRTVELEGKQRDLYETIRISMYEKVREVIAEKGMAKSHIIVLDALLKLRQVCCDPQLLKMDMTKIESAKRNELMTMLPEMLEEGRRILLFSQFTSMLQLIEQELLKLKIPYVKLTGKTIDRETVINSFQKGEVALFLISLKAGGTGLNLTSADTVIHYDPWWNPAVENQATDRAYRIGQDKPVFVYKMITSGTVEEKIIEMQGKKRQLMDSLFDPQAKVAAKLTANDIRTLFEPLG
jgi:superfamily II DNA or RNA helicase